MLSFNFRHTAPIIILIMKNIPVIDVASRGVVVVNVLTPLMELLHLARKTNYQSFPVVKNGIIKGLVSLSDVFKVFYPYEQTFEKYRGILHAWERIYEEQEKDIFDIKLSRESLLNTKVKDIMRTEFPFVYENEPLQKAYDILKKHNVRLLPVLSEDRRVKGVLTTFDIIYYILTRTAT